VSVLEAFVRANTVPTRPPLLPEITLHLAAEVTPLWTATEAALEREGLPPPFWAFAWVGGQAIARWLLDTPGIVAGRNVVDFAAGSGVGGIAAALAGAGAVTALEIDRFAAAAIALNAAANGVALSVRLDDLIGDPLPGAEIVIAGDVCYEKPMAERVIGWLRTLAADGRLVVIGDPGRSYRPADGLVELARHMVPTSRDIEASDLRETVVWQVLPP
jgi:predicted nicotinamide N-methyase